MPEVNVLHHFPNFEEVKTHLRENKDLYVVGGTCLIVGAIGGTVFTGRTRVPSNTISLYFFTSQEKPIV